MWNKVWMNQSIELTPCTVDIIIGTTFYKGKQLDNEWSFFCDLVLFYMRYKDNGKESSKAKFTL